MTPDKSNSNLSSPGIRTTDQRGRGPDPFWPELSISFPATPAEISNWATLIFNASDFLSLFDED